MNIYQPFSGRSRISGGCRNFGFEPDDQWARLPAGWSWREAAGVAIDSKDRVYVFHRGDHPVLVFDRDGSFLQSWGEGLFVRAHGITIGPDDSIYCVDDLDHTVRKFTLDGDLLMTLGESGKPSDTGATSLDYRTIVRSGPPFHYPTNLALNAEGEMYIADGYGNARVHKFSPDGQLLLSWGEPGSGPGQFHVPHGIAVDDEGTVYVADRENHRLQLFTPNGEFISEWTDVARPAQIFIDPMGDIFVAELGHRAGRWSGTGEAAPGETGGRVSIFSSMGDLKARWGGGDTPGAPGDFFAPHDITVDSNGDIYVTEVTISAANNTAGINARDLHTLQKFTRG